MSGRRSEFDQQLAVFLAECCFLTYEQFHNNGSFHVPEGYSLVEGFRAVAVDTTEWFGFIIKSEDSIVVAFRGTGSDPDWIADTEVHQTGFIFPDARTHAGFTSIYTSCREAILANLQKLPDFSRLYVTGHSLGGALAVLHALDATVNTSFRPVMYNFGGPRVGNPGFVTRYNSLVANSIRVVNAYDIIPLLPPRVIKSSLTERAWFYRHVRSKQRISMRAGSIQGNHSIKTYLDALLPKNDQGMTDVPGQGSSQEDSGPGPGMYEDEFAGMQGLPGDEW